MQTPSQPYSLLMPPSPERVLTINFKLPPQYVFFIIRGSLKPIWMLTEEEFLQRVHEFKWVMDTHLDQRLGVIDDELDEDNHYFDEREFIASKKEEIWKYMDPKLYTIFWYMTLQNI